MLCGATDSKARTTAAAGGGGSGGGSINIFTDQVEIPEGSSISSFLNVQGGAGGIASGAQCNYNGGDGGMRKL